MHRLIPVACLIAALGCGDTKSADDEKKPTEDCPWFQQCGQSASGGSCGECDDGDPCTEDRCVAGLTCGHIPLGQMCKCEPECNLADGELGFVQSLTLGQGGIQKLDGMNDVVMTTDRNHVYVAASVSASVTQLVIHNDKPVWASSLEVSDVHRLAISKDSQRVYALGTEQLSVLLRDQELGTLTNTTQSHTGGNAIAVANGWVATVGNSTLVVYSEDGDELIYEHEAKDPGLKAAQNLVFSPDGKHLYVAGYEANVLTAWSNSGGKLKKVGETTDKRGLKSPDAVAISPDGKHVYVGGFCDHDVAILARDPSTGNLSVVGSAWKGSEVPQNCMVMDLEPEGRVTRPTVMKVSPDGKSLVVGSGSLGAPDVTVFDRDGYILTWKGMLD